MLPQASRLFISKSVIIKAMNCVSSRNTTRLVPSLTVKRYFSGLKEDPAKKSNVRPFLSNGSQSEVTIHPPTNARVISSNVGLQSFLRKTYLFTGASIAGSIGIAGLAATYYPTIGITASLIGVFGGALGISFGDFKSKEDVYETYNGRKVVIYSTENSTFRLASFGVLVSGMGMLMAPAFLNNPNAITPALLAASTVFSTSVLYTYSRPVDSLSIFGPTLTTGLTSLLLVGFGGMLSEMYLGSSASLSVALHDANIFFGIPLFAGFIAYDTHKAIQMYQEGNADHLSCAVNLYLDFMNLFIRFMGRSDESS